MKKKNLLWYFLAVVAVFTVKVYYRTADSDALKWILAPTTWWVRTFSGISFEYTAPMGYISHAYRFIIAPSCSGVRFLLLVFVMTIISFTDRMDSFWKKGAWFLFSVFFFPDRIFLYIPGCPRTHSVDQAGLDLKDPSASGS